MPVIPISHHSLRVEHSVIPDDAPVDGLEAAMPTVPEASPGDGNILRLEHPDGSVTISLDGRSLVGKGSTKKLGWFDNLAEDIEPMELSRISEDLLRGVRDDLDSRKEWVEEVATGIRLLALKVETPNTQGNTDGAPVEGMSKVRHPMLLEAVLRFQANARSEMLPTDGPVKIRDDTNQGSVQRDEIADAFEKDFNHYLTSTAVEYYPDTDKMFFTQGFSGCGFKKVFHCPLRNRPVSETVDAADLIVNNSATSLETAKRVTHRIFMRPSLLKRMQIIGAYRDIELGTPKQRDITQIDQEKANQQGIKTNEANPEDRDHEIYEIYCELDIKGYEHKHKNKPSGLEIPYIVTIDLSSREVLAVARNFDKETEALPEARKTFVKFPFVPAFGFYDIGLLHILGNTTTAVTAGWREMLDAGMFANFPGWLQADNGMRQDTNIFRIPPGGAAKVNTGGMPIQDTVMPLPYKDPSPAFMGLITNMVETGQRVGGTSELQVGEGRTDAPVGTTLAMIEQAIKVLNSVHKRMHTAQDQEFQLIKECFRQNPESFWKANRRPARKWDQETFLKALDDYDLVPKADPNTSSHAQRLMKVTALKQLQASNPDIYDAVAVDSAILGSIGWSPPEQFFKKPEERNQMPPEMIKGIEDIKVAHQIADARTMTAEAAMIKAKKDAPPAPGEPPAEPPDPVELAKLQLAEKQGDQEHERALIADKNRDQDRAEKAQQEEAKVQQAEAKMQIDAQTAEEKAFVEQQKAESEALRMQMDDEREQMLQQEQREHDRQEADADRKHEAEMQKREHAAKLKIEKAKPKPKPSPKPSGKK